MFLYVCSCLEAAAVYEMKLVAFNGNGESDCSKRLVSLGEGATSNRNDGRCPVQNMSSKTSQTHRCCFELHVFDVRRKTGVSMQWRGGVAGQRRHRHPHWHSLHHLLRTLPGFWIPAQVSTPFHLFSPKQLRESILIFQCFWSLFCSKGSQGSWSVPRNGAGHDVKDRVKHLRVEPSLQVQLRWFETVIHLIPHSSRTRADSDLLSVLLCKPSHVQEVCPSQCQVIIEHSSGSPGQGTG